MRGAVLEESIKHRGEKGVGCLGRAATGSGRSFIWALKMETVGEELSRPGEEQVLTRPALVSFRGNFLLFRTLGDREH